MGGELYSGGKIVVTNNVEDSALKCAASTLLGVLFWRLIYQGCVLLIVDGKTPLE